MSAVVNYSDATSRQLDAKPQPDEIVSEQDVADAPKLSRLLTRILRELVAIRRQWVPRSITFTNVPLDNTGTALFRLTHRFRGAVNWYVVGWRDAAGRPDLTEDDATDRDTLVLISNETGTADIQVVERG